VGVIPDAEIFEFKLTPNDQFIVIASDGVWEFMENDLIAKIVVSYYPKGLPEAAANAIVKEAYKHWRKDEEVIDDIT